MAIFISVIVIQSTGRYWAPLLVLLTVTAMFLPPLVPPGTTV